MKQMSDCYYAQGINFFARPRPSAHCDHSNLNALASEVLTMAECHGTFSKLRETGSDLPMRGLNWTACATCDEKRLRRCTTSPSTKWLRATSMRPWRSRSMMKPAGRYIQQLSRSHNRCRSCTWLAGEKRHRTLRRSGPPPNILGWAVIGGHDQCARHVGLWRRSAGK